MSKDNVGGAAFPTNQDSLYLGMSLRDYFAAKALPVVMQTLKQDWEKELGNDWYWNSNEIGQLAEHSYRLADAMLKARDAEEE